MAGKAHSKGKHVSKTAHLASYKSNMTWQRNKIRKLKRHLKANENDSQSAGALKSIQAGSKTYGREAPRKRIWTHAKKHLAHLLKFLGDDPRRALIEPHEEQRRAQEKTRDYRDFDK